MKNPLFCIGEHIILAMSCVFTLIFMLLHPSKNAIAFQLLFPFYLHYYIYKFVHPQQKGVQLNLERSVEGQKLPQNINCHILHALSAKCMCANDAGILAPKQKKRRIIREANRTIEPKLLLIIPRVLRPLLSWEEFCCRHQTSIHKAKGHFRNFHAWNI